MAQQALHTDDYTLYPSPQNLHREIFLYQAFVLQPYALIDLPSLRLQGRYSLFAAYRKADGKMGQLVTFELDVDRLRFEREFVPD
ncbi:hypothetical protein SAMN05428957_107128 [Oryzisolibacter propanilivorax]|uniref:Uncharacterized protein n=1 Tax=Oryzisolibacter propanilivorax TaxID=1527607 RepID=A0A1G9U1H9_9BURK|nr:hypothetical protein [Oryzisolibacter propanilivorax]SDM53877.1 hypothetical protein SAMN05428957_107128 [Oryzisolibacter propanilivorax]